MTKKSDIVELRLDLLDDSRKLDGLRKLTEREQDHYRKRTVRLLREGKKRWAQADRINHPLPPDSKIAKQMRARKTAIVKFIVAAYASVPSDKRPADFEQLVMKNVQAIAFGALPKRLYAHLVKPWKGAAGRKAARQTRLKRGDQTCAKVLKLYRAGIGSLQIAEKLKISQQHVNRILKKAGVKR